jgi:signal transduction histidine kinase
LLCYEAGRFRSFPASVHLPKTIYGISEDRNGSLWLSSNTGIFRVDRHSLLSGSTEAVPYGTADGLRVNEASGGGHPAVWKSHDGTLWFATPRGIAVMTPAQQNLNRVPPPVVIESVLIDDAAANPALLASVPPGHNRYAFEYAGLSFVAPQKVLYRYKLEGFDHDWIEAGTRRVAYYTNLSPGQYRFHVLARNNDGIWNSQGVSIPLVLQPHLYQRVWFLSLCALALAGFVYQLYRLRVRQVAARYDAVLAERNRIAREIHDTLAQGFAALSVQLEILSRLLDDAPQPVRQHLAEARALVRDSLAEARRSIWELRSQSAASNDLAAQLGKLTQPPRDNGQPRVTLDVQGTFRPLPENIELELLRIAQESVRNATRHAHASHIRMTLAFGRKLVTLLVKDDGVGFDLAKRLGSQQGHYGLDGMRERARQIGARLSVESAPGQGTTVFVEVPLR